MGNVERPENLQELSLVTAAWEGDRREPISFPAPWDVHVQLMAGHAHETLGAKDLKQALENPIGAPPLTQLARNKRRVCIIFDDLTRPTPVDEILPHMLHQLKEAGIKEHQIRFVAATAAHHPLSRRDFIKKLGQGIIERFPIYTHNMYEHNDHVGKTPLGMNLYINREVLSCDLKIGVGSILPYWWPGTFSGGAKIVLPGVSSRTSIIEHHRLIKKARSDNGTVSMADVWRNIADAGRTIGLNLIINTVLNARREILGVFAGDPDQAYETGCSFAAEVYETKPAPRSDVVITNTYPQDLQIGKAFWGVHASLKPGGDAVIVARHPEGLSHLHHLTSRCGTDYGGENWNPDFKLSLGSAKHIYFWVDQIIANDRQDLPAANGVGVSFHTRWEDIRNRLLDKYGSRASVAVYPYASIQYPSGLTSSSE